MSWRFFEAGVALVVTAMPAYGGLSRSVVQELGLVVARGAPVARIEPAAQQSYYEQIIDPVGGLTADELVRQALAHNGELAAARQMIAEARGKLRQAGLRPNPMLETSAARAVNTPDNELAIEAELPLELGGRRSARVVVAEWEIQLRHAEVADFERRLAAEVRSRYAEAIAAVRDLKFTEDLLTLTRDSYRIVRARVEHGRSAPLEQNLLQVEVSRIDSMRLGLEGRAQVALLELKKTTGKSPDEPLRLRGEFSIDQQPPSLTEATRIALAKRADLVAARAAEALSRAQVERARSEGRVDASIFGGYMRQSMGFDVQGFNSGGALAPVQGIFHFATFGVRLTLPVRNKNEGLIEAAIAAETAARTRREFAEVVIRNEVAAAYTRYQHAQAALAVYRDNVREQALRNLDVIHQTYVLGQKTVLDYLTEQRRFIEVETAYTGALKELLESLIEIERTAGSSLPSA